MYFLIWQPQNHLYLLSKVLQATCNLIMLSGLPPKKNVDLFFNPILIVWGVCITGFVVYQAG